MLITLWFMVKEITKDGKKYFQCESCGFLYEDKELAQKCEDFCNKYHSCSLEITKHAVELWFLSISDEKIDSVR